MLLSKNSMDLKVIVTINIFILSMTNLNHCFDLFRFDYIIVGAGSAGAALANRLSEDKWVSVLLLEAGEKAPERSYVPLLLGAYGTGTSINWNYTVEPDNNSCLGAVDNRCGYFMGRTLGGSSQINFMVYVRGSKKDYDLWAENGATGWSYKDVLPYFKKSEGVTISPPIIEEVFHGKYGPLTVSVADYKTEFRDAYLVAIREAGFKILDYNGAIQQGFGVAQLNTRNGLRCSTEKAYLQPAYSRRNLKIVTGALVTKVIINTFKVATGVKYLKDGKYFTVKAKKEVILSAGGIKTPQLLMLSGIGPKKHLEKFNIKVIADLPVGQNLQDHIACNALIYTVQARNAPSFNYVNNLTSTISNHIPNTFTGILSSPNLLEVSGYSKSPFEKIEGDYNDLQYFFISRLTPQPFYRKEIMSFLEKLYNKPAFSVLTTLIHPKSRGSITLKSTDPTAAPLIVMNYFQDPQDIQVLLHGLKTARKIIESTNEFYRFGVKLVGPVPGCEGHSLNSDEYLLCAARTFTVSLYHASGTCKMGQLKDKTTVVDTKLRVKGIKRLRVVDASIMPKIVSANTNAPTIMIAEKAADIIKNLK